MTGLGTVFRVVTQVSSLKLSWGLEIYFTEPSSEIPWKGVKGSFVTSIPLSTALAANQPILATIPSTFLAYSDTDSFNFISTTSIRSVQKGNKIQYYSLPAPSLACIH